MNKNSVAFSYGDGHINYAFDSERFLGQLISELHSYKPPKDQWGLVADSLENPIGTPRLCVMAENKKNIVIIDSDHTRPVPSKIIIPQVLEEIRKGSPNANITILISTGTHRATTTQELVAKFGQEIVDKENIVVHDCDTSECVNLGKLPSGGNMIVNKLAIDADLLVAVGFIEPHFFAGFSGGRKSLLPGVANRETVVYNHNSEFIDNPYARTGILDNNPIHIDMLYTARMGNLAFICNVIINSEKEVVHAVSGDVDLAHRAGVAFLASKCQVKSMNADIAVSTNGGYPLDQNIYQAVKGMTTAEATVRKGGVIIMLARSNDGHGEAAFYKTLKESKDLDELQKSISDTPKNKTIDGQWQSQILVRVLKHSTVIYVSEASDEMVKDCHMIPAKTLQEAMEKAEEIVGKNSKIVAIPDGIAVMVV